MPFRPCTSPLSYCASCTTQQLWSFSFSQSRQRSLIPHRSRFGSLTGAIPLECSPLVIIECSVCVCLELVWKGVFCWLAPGGCTKKSKAFIKKSAKNQAGPFIWPSTVRPPHTNQADGAAGEKARQSHPMRDPRLKLPPLPAPPYSPAMFYRLGCINHSSLINLQECCPRLPPLHNVKQGVLSTLLL